jgi:hypothetical protein
VLALGGEELGPGNDLGVLLEQGAALALGHATPHAEFDTVVQGVSTAFKDHRAMPADNGGLALGSAAYKELIWISLAAPGLGYPGNAGFGLCALDNAVC